jgi:integrase
LTAFRSNTKNRSTADCRNIIEVHESLEQTKREYRKSQLELRMKLGGGKLQDDNLLFSKLEGGPLSPAAISTAWGEYMARIGMPGVTFHALRHTHASQLIDAGVDL